MHIESFVEDLRFKEPLSIAGRTLEGQSVLRIAVRHGQWTAHAEAAGVFYRGETGATMRDEVDQVARRLPDDILAAWGVVRQMSPGGARNALDWALWQLVAAARGQPAYQPAFLPAVRPLCTMVTLSFGSPDDMARHALGHTPMKYLKLKLGGTPDDAACVAAVRTARPDARLFVDANEGWTLDHFDGMLGPLVQHRVELIEQPLPAAADAALENFRSPIPLAADESLQTIADLDRVARRYHVANIKLDKCGGITAALGLAFEARRRGMRVMVGCMGGRSMAMLPAFIVAQYTDLVDLDAPLLMAGDSEPAAIYVDGTINFAEAAFRLSGVTAANASPSPVRHAAS